MAKKLYINLDADDPISALVVSQNSSANENAPAYVFGDNVAHEVYLCSDPGTGMTYDATSGAENYTIKMAIGIPGAEPTSGTYTLTYGANTTTALAYNADASTIETALNLLASVVSAGGLDVTGTFPDFTVTFRSVGARTLLSGSTVNLSPSSQILAYELTAGDGTTQEVQFFRVIRAAAAAQTTWTRITNGWSGLLNLNTPGILEVLAGAASSTEAYLEVEVTDPSGYVRTVLHVPITVRAEIVNAQALSSDPLATYPDMDTIAAVYHKSQAQYVPVYNPDNGLYYKLQVKIENGALVPVIGDPI